jgi:competence protein ComEC
MLICSPKLLNNISFQLSFLAVFSIIFFLPIFNIYLAKFFKFFKKEKFFYKSKIVSLLSLSLAINIFIWPVVVYYFSYYNYLSFIYNLFIIPIMPFFLIFSFLAIISPVFKVIFFYVLYILGKYINLISFLDFGYFELVISLKFLFIYYLIMFFILFRHSVYFGKKKILKFIKKANEANKKIS